MERKWKPHSEKRAKRSWGKEGEKKREKRVGFPISSLSCVWLPTQLKACSVSSLGYQSSLECLVLPALCKEPRPSPFTFHLSPWSSPLQALVTAMAVDIKVKVASVHVYGLDCFTPTP